MKTGIDKFFQALLWYTLLTSIAAIFIDLISFLQSLSTGGFSEFFFLLFFLIFESACLFATIKLLRSQHTKYSFKFILFYWIAQSVFFGIKGNTYGFTTGPEIAFFIKYVETIDWGYFLKFWSQEFSIKLNTDSNIVYIGTNLIPLLISIALVCLYKKIPHLTGTVNNNE